MIMIVRATDPRVVQLMHFFDSDVSSGERDGNCLAELMTKDADNVFVSVGIENDKVVCHVCGKRDKNWVWVYNGWSKPSTPKRSSRACLDMIKKWAKTMNINQLRCETFHNPEIMHRAHGWEKYSTILKLGIAQ